VGVVLELPAPGMQDAGETRQVCPDAPLVLGQPFEGERRGGEHGVVRAALRRADEGSERLRHGEGEEEVRPGQVLLQVVCEPRLGFMLLTLGTVAVATRMIDAVLPPTTWARREAVAVGSALAGLESADDRAVGGGQVGIALQVCWSNSREDIAEGGQGRSPCMRVLRRA